MSGSMIHRVNRGWDSTVQPNMTPARFFWDFIKFINDHPGMVVLEVGTGTTSYGSIIPAAWLSWDGATDPATLSPALAPNSWVVWRAVNADPLLNGGGTMPWEAKVQATWGATAYADPSGINYGQNGNTARVVLRSSPAGVWVGTPTWDFVTPGGEEVSQDIQVQAGADIDYWLDLVGDDDTLFWKGGGGDFPTDNPQSRSRGGYLGMITRRSPVITWPFWMTAGPINDSPAALTSPNQTNSKNDGNTYYVWAHNFTWYWPSFSLGRDGTAVSGSQVHRVDSYHPTFLNAISPNIYTGDDVFLAILLKEQKAIDRYDILGELRLLWVVDKSYGQHTVVGDNADLIQFLRDSTTYGGIVMPWPAGVVPSW